MPPLPQVFVTTPIAHRGLHGPDAPENSLAAADAAIAAGYGIELDIQPAACGTPMVFHDYDLARLTGQPGFIATSGLDDIAGFRLLGTDQGVPTLAQFLDRVAGRVPLLIEIKDQDGACGPNTGDLSAAVARVLAGYAGPVAVMSFNPHMVAAFRDVAPDTPVGLTTCDFGADDWPNVPDARREELAQIADFDAVGASFMSHDHTDLTRPRVADLRAAGHPVLCWTIRNAESERAARRHADNITFEDYTPAAS
ncbi:glycerophosphodiester phosphodiesterase family protein [Paracoccus sp. (in: a-proteobacteria)]|uniref:glycerophosphodiester phosphodiesterase family protein n=1 Tax=Paracoccus sp. TaxID=267 RepID=UPI0026E10394|nr:glycerophosphodiester phosphodiesterase family protein [Paracoccus sp. (in: a-proteobacteria)]MDO5647448.1 glycerophosphodiester phosphodiesterase family protein [Paracoccus sp. (in: a-proteobacteria)]